MNLRSMRIFLYVLITLLLTSCGSDNKVLFDMEMTHDFVLLAGLNTTETHYFIRENVNTFFSSHLNGSSASIDDIKTIVANRAQLKDKFGDIYFDFIQSISIHAFHPLDPSNKKELFYMDFVPFDEDETLNMFSSIADLTDLLTNDLVNLEIKIKLRTITPTSIDTRLTMSFSVIEKE